MRGIKKVRQKFVNVVTDAMEKDRIKERLEYNQRQVQQIENQLSEVNAKLNEVTRKVDELSSLLGYVTNRQTYLNAFTNPELFMLKKHSEGDVLLCGNYGDPNLGDEWMLQTMLEYLGRYCSKKVTVMLAPNRCYDVSSYRNVNFIHFPQTIYDFATLADNFDEIIFGGGAIVEEEYYQEKYDFGVALSRILSDLSLEFIKRGKKVFIIGVSASKELKKTEFIQKMKKVFCEAWSITVRDKNTLDTLKKAGISTERTNLIPDIVYANTSLNKYFFDTKKESLSDKVHQENNIGITFIVNEQTKPKLGILIKSIKKYYLRKNKAFKITLIPFHDLEHNDMNFYKEITKDDENIEFIPYTSDINKVIDIFAKQNIMINMRYHAMLIAMTLGIKTINVLYDEHPHYFNKVDYLMQQFGYSAKNCIRLSDIEKECQMDKFWEKAVVVRNAEKAEGLLNTAKNELETIVREFETRN